MNLEERAKYERILQGEKIGFPELIDNTARSAWHKCGELFFRSAVQQLRGRGASSIHLHAGGAFAAGLEAARLAFYEDQKSQAASEELGLGALYSYYNDEQEREPAKSGDKSLEGLVRAYESYMLEYPLGMDDYVPIDYSNGRRGIEFSFAAAIPDVLHPETGNPLLFGGRFDMLAVRKGDPAAIYVLDEKTGASLGEQWANQWRLDSQFTGYCWGARSYGIPVVGAVIRGVGLLKTKTTHAQCIVYRPQWMVDRWLEHLVDDAKEMIKAWKKGYYRMALDKSACNAYGACPMLTLCESPNPAAWVANHYQVVQWNPLVKKGRTA